MQIAIKTTKAVELGDAVEWGDRDLTAGAACGGHLDPAAPDRAWGLSATLSTWEAVRLVAQVDGVTVGVIVGAISGDGQGIVHGPVVEEAARRRGVGTRLLAELTAMHQQIGLSEQRIVLDEGNLPAARLFSRHGFLPLPLGTGPEPAADGERVWARQFDAWSW